MLRPEQIADLPLKKFKSSEMQKPGEKAKCMVCLCEFEEEEAVRTLKCFHTFHKACIDKWLTRESGSCPVCKVIQKV